jgi:hypothetical protein
VIRMAMESVMAGPSKRVDLMVVGRKCKRLDLHRLDQYPKLRRMCAVTHNASFLASHLLKIGAGIRRRCCPVCAPAHILCTQWRITAQKEKGSEGYLGT